MPIIIHTTQIFLTLENPVQPGKFFVILTICHHQWYIWWYRQLYICCTAWILQIGSLGSINGAVTANQLFQLVGLIISQRYICSNYICYIYKEETVNSGTEQHSAIISQLLLILRLPQDNVLTHSNTLHCQIPLSVPVLQVITSSWSPSWRYFCPNRLIKIWIWIWISKQF